MALFKKKSKVNTGGKIYINAQNKGGHFEDYNRLKDNVLYLNADGKNKVIQIESSVMAEGKTTVVCNLAVGLGLTNKKVIVVDLDFRRPRVHRLFSLAKDVGIADYFLGDATKEQIIANACNAIGNYNACKIKATVESICTNGGNAIGNYNV